MTELKNTTKLVKKVLEEVPATRNSDNYLYIKVVGEINQHALRMPLAVVLQNLNTFNLPSIETVGRCRRKLQAEFPALRADKTVEEYRSELETEFREWAGEHDERMDSLQ